ncbi:MAG TPA: hypothetical protein VN213_15915 [Solirubrobacteraceae bacterium]|nr:hypothetical protein [Solirubrobacteraceae bacterium]
MGRRGVLAALAATMAIAAPPAAAQSPAPGAADGVSLVASLPELKFATAINFLQYGTAPRGRDVMFATGRFGLAAYDVGDPRRPRLLDGLGNEDLRLAGDLPVDADDSDGTVSTYWQNEDMDVDARRKLVFLARDPRSFGKTTRDDAAVAGVYIVDASNPRDLRLLTFHQLPTGHTTTCINDCDFLWTGGPASSASQLGAWPGGRPIIVTDIRDPRNPRTAPQAVDLFRDDGVTAYSHDVQVDGDGVAWVSGQGGVRGYWTEGMHRDPLLGRVRRATPTNPIPYAGGEFDTATAPSAFMHNAFRAVGDEAGDGPEPGHGRDPSQLLLATEEADAPPDCNGLAQFSIASLAGSFRGGGWRSRENRPFRLQVVGRWSPHGEAGTHVDATIYCSAHYFDAEDGLLAYSWYDQGTRFIDVRNPRRPRQVAYFRPEGGISWAPYFHGRYVYVADHGRGVEILRLDSRRRATVVAPAPSARHLRLVRAASAGLRPDPELGWMCPLPAA